MSVRAADLGARAALCKEAQFSIDDNNALKREALRDVLAAMGLAGAGGAGLALLGRLGGGKPYPSSRVPGPTRVEVPYPVFNQPPKKKRGTSQVGFAHDTADLGFPLQGEKLARFGVFNVMRQEGDPASFLAGDQAQTKSQLPWQLPLMLGGALPAALLGHHLTKGLLARKQKADTEAELEQARREYQKAMLSDYDPSHVGLAKASSTPAPGEGSFASDLEKLACALEKKGWGEGLAGTGVNALGALAGLLTLGSGYLGYKYFHDRSQGKLLEEALKARQRQLAAVRPPEVEAVPVAVKMKPHGPVAQHPEDLDHLGEEKVALVPHPGQQQPASPLGGSNNRFSFPFPSGHTKDHAPAAPGPALKEQMPVALAGPARPPTLPRGGEGRV